MAYLEKGKKWYRLHWQEYYAKNREKILARNAKFRKRNSAELNAKARTKGKTPEGRAKKRAAAMAHYYRMKGKLTPERRQKISLNFRRWVATHRQARRAHMIIQNEIRTGRLVRPGACSSCGKLCKPEAHHPDHYKPLSIVWLCKPCHGKTTRI